MPPSYDQSIINEILRRGSKVRDPRARNRYVRAALQTGIVESGLRNLDYGDADSLGWRQERQSLYKNPMNVRASVDRFFREAEQHDRGQPSWQLAADVQRPAAQYRGRYKDVARQAAQILGGGSSVPFDPGGSSSGTAPTSTPPSALLGGRGSDFLGLAAALVDSRPPVPQAPPVQVAPPAGAAAPPMPEGFRPATVTAPPTPPREDGVSQALSLLERLGGDSPAVTPPDPDDDYKLPIAQTVADDRAGRVRLPKNGRNPWGVVEQAGRSGRYLQKRYAIKEIGGYRASDPFPDHPSRKALDLMVYDDRAKGDAIADDLIRNYKQHGVKYLIWRQRIWKPGEGWRKMEDRGSPTQNHEDHVHVLYK